MIHHQSKTLVGQGFKVMASVGGWNFQSRYFFEMVSTQDRRAKFTTSAKAFFTQYNMAGIDIQLVLSCSTLKPDMSCESLSFSVTGTDAYPVVDSFDDLDLQESLLRDIYSHGFTKPSAAHQRGTRPVLDGRDAIGQVHS